MLKFIKQLFCKHMITETSKRSLERPSRMIHEYKCSKCDKKFNYGTYLLMRRNDKR